MAAVALGFAGVVMVLGPSGDGGGLAQPPGCRCWRGRFTRLAICGDARVVCRGKCRDAGGRGSLQHWGCSGWWALSDGWYFGGLALPVAGRVLTGFWQRGPGLAGGGSSVLGWILVQAAGVTAWPWG